MSSRVDDTDGPVETTKPPSNAALRIVYQAVRALVADDGVVTVGDLTAVTCLDDETATAAMNGLTRMDPVDIEPRAVAGEPAWAVTRTDRW